MKSASALILGIAVSVGVVPFAVGQSDEMKGMEMKKNPATSKTHKSVGVVKSVDGQKGTITINHEPVPSMNWSAMTMTFDTRDEKLLHGVKAGQKVHFEFVQQGSKYVVTSVK